MPRILVPHCEFEQHRCKDFEKRTNPDAMSFATWRNVVSRRPRLLAAPCRQQVRQGDFIFTQGGKASKVYYIERGRVKLTAVSPCGKEATVAVLSPGMFFGEACLSGEAERLVTARALTACSLISIGKRECEAMLRENLDATLERAFVSFLLNRSREFEQYAIDQVFNCCEQRLMRILVALAYSNRDSRQERTIRGITHEMLAGLIGSTRPRITEFMAKFRRLRLIDYSRREIVIRPALREAMLGLHTHTFSSDPVAA